MSFPSPSEYDDAIQNLSSAFIDTELKNGKNDGPLRFGVHGTVASGSFAIVYRIKCGSKRFAVKCFTSQPPDNQRQRYSTIHDHLSRSQLKCSVGFEYLEDGVHVRGITYPILKMEWMEAPTLLKHIPTQLADSVRLRRLTDSFLNLSGELRRNKIAHGDLQHGNLLVSGDDLKIIDYDGMCVPGTNGFPSVENGLPPYQHPKRNGGKLNLNLDHFSSLVIWTSLHALSLDSNLWRLHVGDAERLLFQQSDFANPQTSQIFKKLLTYKDARLAKAVSALRDACLVSDLQKIPHIEDVLAEKIDWWKPDETTKRAKNEPLPDWIGAYRVVIGDKNPVTLDNITYGDSPTAGDSWITTQESAKPKKELVSVKLKTSLQKAAPTQAPRVDYGKSVYISQACVALTICSSLWQGFSQFTNGLASLGSLVYVITLHGFVGIIFIYLAYLRSKVRGTITKIDSELSVSLLKKGDLCKKLASINNKIQANEVQKHLVSELKRNMQALEEQHKTKAAELESEFLGPISEVESELNRINLLENQKDGKMVIQMQTTINKIEDRIVYIENNRQVEVTKTHNQINKIQEETSVLLQKLRLELHKKLSVEMSKVPINSGCVDGWMSSVTKLHQAGIMNSSDIFEVEWRQGVGMICTKTSGSRVEFRGISKRMTQSLNDWLVALRNESKAKHINHDLAPEVLRQIRDDETNNIERLSEILRVKMDVFDSELLNLSREKNSEQQRFIDLREEIKIEFESRRKQVASKKIQIKNNYENRYRELVEPIISSITNKKHLVLEKSIETASESSNLLALKKCLELELSEKKQALIFFEMQKDAHKLVSFRHYLRRVFS